MSQDHINSDDEKMLVEYDFRSGVRGKYISRFNSQISLDQIKSFCSRWKIDQFALFGSVLRSDFSDKSDIDVLVTFKKDAEWSLFDQVDMKDELQAIFGRPVDMISRRGIEGSRNYMRRQEILNSAKVIYGVS